MNEEPAEPARLSRRRLLAFAVVVIACAAGSLGYLVYRGARAKAAQEAVVTIAAAPLEALPDAGPEPAPGDPPSEATAGTGAVGRPYTLFRSTALGESYGRVSAAYLDGEGGPRLVSPLRCERVHFAAGRGVCLEAQRGVLTSYYAHVFDREFKVRWSHALAGPPSRARMSADGRLAALTVFVTGHSYASASFSTRTTLVDAAEGQVLVEDLESFQVLREGEPIRGADFNFWGVSFARDGRRFYATLGTAGKTLLVEGDLSTRQMRVLRDDVECPSLSPGGALLAFKRRRPAGGRGRFAWGLHVLELETGSERFLGAETRSVDDHVEWLGDREILYALPADDTQASAATNVWALAVDGGSAPRLFLPSAFSPAWVR